MLKLANILPNFSLWINIRHFSSILSDSIIILLSGYVSRYPGQQSFFLWQLRNVSILFLLKIYTSTNVRYKLLYFHWQFSQYFFLRSNFSIWNYFYTAFASFSLLNFKKHFASKIKFRIFARPLNLHRHLLWNLLP